MPAKNTSKGDTPRLCLRRSPSGTVLAYATLNGRAVSFGPMGPEAQRRYDQAVARWLANGRLLPDENQKPSDYRVADLVADYLTHAKGYYLDPAGGPGREFVNLRTALRPLLEQFGELPAIEFGPACLRQLREGLVAASRLCRKEINSRVHRIRRAFKWAAAEELIPATVPAALTMLESLKLGKTAARESPRVLPVAEEVVREVVKHLCPTVAAMIWFAYWTGARPGEVCSLRWSMIDRAGPVWIASLQQHKTAWRGRERKIAIGPKAQESLLPLLRPEPDGFVFQPHRAVAEQRFAKRERRRTPLTPSQRARAERAQGLDAFAESFTVRSFGKAIDRAVFQANAARLRRQVLATVAEAHGGILPKDIAGRVARLPASDLLTLDGDLRLQEGRLHRMFAPDLWARIESALLALPLLDRWGPNRLRHAAATRIRREVGLEAARVVLGHARAAVTEVYAEVDHARSAEIAARFG